MAAREPGGTPLGEAIREVVLSRSDLEIPPRAELLLMLAARAAFVRDVVRPALEGGRVVVADRYSLSTLAYQGYARGLPLRDVRDAVRVATEGLEPDLYVVLDLPAEEGRARQERDGRAADRIEEAGLDFLRRVREGYLELARTEPRVRVVDARGTPEEVHERILRVLAAEFPETFDGAGPRA